MNSTEHKPQAIDTPPPEEVGNALQTKSATEHEGDHGDLKWYQQSFGFVLSAAVMLPWAPLVAFALFSVGMINTDRDKWFRTRFLVFLVVMVTLFGVLQSLYNAVTSQ